MEYKIQDDIMTRDNKFGRFYSNIEIGRKINEKINLDDDLETEGDFSRFNDPNVDISQLMDCLSEQDGDPFIFVNSLIHTIKERFEEVRTIIEESKFIPFLVNSIKTIPSEYIIVKISLMKLAHTILDNYKSLHPIFYAEKYLQILSEFIKEESDPAILTYSIFSIIHLFNSFEQTNTSDFINSIDICMLRDAYYRIIPEQNIIEKRKYIFQYLKGAIVFASKVIFVHRLNKQDCTAAFNLAMITLSLKEDENEKNILKKWNRVYVFALKTFSYLAENGDIDFEIFETTRMCDVIQQKILSNNFNNQIFACDIFVALFNQGYFNNHFFDVPINRILDCIDNCLQEKLDSAAFIRLLAAIIRFDDDGKYVQQFYGVNNLGILTICNALLNSNFGAMESSAICIIELLQKISGDFLYQSLDEKVIKSINRIIEIGMDLNDEELLLSILQVFHKILDFSQKCDKLDDVRTYLRKCSGFELIEELDQFEINNQEIDKLLEKVKQILKDEEDDGAE